ncbi:DUF3010 family protein [Lacimicrobium alkaliphilum]|uniref:DUF3010 domain-containing protein n=1 Tax=Lacimicrobium alkaliphilum TaxID=1526571 RepID=A0A0U3AU38_9ALTE|nr:DUF3010 family protein [Lacimicrobium alkaliphilum]ALS97615.1 hypothetical protein AT746_04570 [Lacimicrobium alkaliphilum]
MKVCGVDLKGNEANICLLSLIDGLFHVPDCRSRKLTLADTSAKGLKHFQSTFAKLVADYKIEKVIIRQRPAKGKFAGGAIGFKLEAAIELIDNLEVVVFSPTDIKESLRRNPLAVPFAETGLKQFQETAFNTAYAWLMKSIHTS